jgi:DNA-binding transcriptional MerR regulator
MRYTSLQLSKLFNVSIKTLSRWVAIGLLNPAGRGRFSYGEIDVLAIGICRDMRAKGSEAAQIRPVLNWLRTRTIEELEAQCELGRVYMLQVGEQAPFHRMLTEAELFENPSIDLKAAAEVSLPLTIVNVAKAIEIMRQKLQELDGVTP